MFGSLISAVDPVSTLAAFQSLGVEPRIYALIYGEAILNDAVAIVAFKVFSTIAEGFSLTAAAYETAYISIGSVCIGLLVGILATLLFKYHGSAPPGSSKRSFAHMAMGWHEKKSASKDTTSDGDLHGTPPDLPPVEHKSEHSEGDSHSSTHDAMIFFFASLCCYYTAESLPQWYHLRVGSGVDLQQVCHRKPVNGGASIFEVYLHHIERDVRRADHDIDRCVICQLPQGVSSVIFSDIRRSCCTLACNRCVPACGAMECRGQEQGQEAGRG